MMKIRPKFVVYSIRTNRSPKSIVSSITIKIRAKSASYPMHARGMIRNYAIILLCCYGILCYTMSRYAMLCDVVLCCLAS